MKRIMQLFLIMLLPIFFYGCWDRREVNDLALVVGGTFDQVDIAEKTGVRFTLQIIKPEAMASQGMPSGPGESGGKAFWIVSETGENIREALSKMNNRIPKQIFLGHERINIFGEKAARSGLTPFFDRLVRSRESRDNHFIAISRGEASKILKLESPVAKSTALALNDIFQDKDGWQGILAVHISDFLYRLSTGVTSPLAPVVEIIPQTSLTPEEKESDLVNTVAVTGLAVFDTKGRLVGYLNERESMGLIWVMNKAKNRSLSIPHIVGGSEESVSLNLIKAKSKIIVNIEDDGLPAFEINMQANFDLFEQFGQHWETADVGLVADLEKTASTQVINEIETVVKRSQQFNTDVLGFGEEFRRQHSKDWPQYKEHWPDIYPTVNVTIKCETRIHNRGLTVEPPGSRTEGEGQ